MKCSGILCIALAVLMAGGCSMQLQGRVVGTNGDAVPNAIVEAEGWRGGMITGEAAFIVKTKTDQNGHFTLETPAAATRISATSPDGKRKAEVSSPSRFQENVVVVK